MFGLLVFLALSFGLLQAAEPAGAGSAPVAGSAWLIAAKPDVATAQRNGQIKFTVTVKNNSAANQTVEIAQNFWYATSDNPVVKFGGWPAGWAWAGRGVQDDDARAGRKFQPRLDRAGFRRREARQNNIPRRDSLAQKPACAGLVRAGDDRDRRQQITPTRRQTLLPSVRRRGCRGASRIVHPCALPQGLYDDRLTSPRKSITTYRTLGFKSWRTEVARHDMADDSAAPRWLRAYSDRAWRISLDQICMAIDDILRSRNGCMIIGYPPR